MHTRILISIISLISLLSLTLCGCKSEPAQKTRFGQTDAMQDGATLANINGEVIVGENDEVEGEVITGGAPIKTAKSLNVDELPANIEKMVGLCDAINMVCVKKQKTYSPDDEDFIWHCVHMYIGNCNDKKMQLSRVGNYIEADPKVVKDIVFAISGKLRVLPQIPETEMSETGGEAHIMMGNNLKYRFSVGDRGLSEPEVRRVTQYSDGSLEMEVALVDSETHEETVCFIYSLRANTKDTTTSARFSYEITGARSADKATSDKINGMPYLVPVIQVYGYDSYPKGDPRYTEVKEVLMFASFAEHIPGMDELNSRITSEVLSAADEEDPEGGQTRICSYPVTTSELVQVATKIVRYRDSRTIPDVYCYNYDIKKSRSMDRNDALSICGLSADELSESIASLWAQIDKDGENPLVGSRYAGFMVREDGSADVYYILEVADDEAGTVGKIVVYNSVSKKIRIIGNDDDLLPASEVDDTRPRLTHGRKDQ